MSENTLLYSDAATITSHPRPLETILLGGLSVGILDMLFAFVFYGFILKIPYLRIFQGVAAGLLGRDAATEGGVKTFILGLVLHFIVATCIAAVYYVLTLFLPFLVRHAVACGLVYGLVAYLVMNYLVIPLSAIDVSKRTFNLSTFLPAFIAHAFLVGLPIALIARRSAKANRSAS